MFVTQQTFLVFQDVFKTSWRRLQCNTSSSKTSWRRLQDVIKTYLQYVFLKRLQVVFKTSLRRLPRPLQDVFKTSSRRVCKTSYNYVFKTSSRLLGRQKNVTLKTSWRRLQYVFTKANLCWESIFLSLVFQYAWPVELLHYFMRFIWCKVWYKVKCFKGFLP